jgi:hypothetical protein
MLLSINLLGQLGDCELVSNFRGRSMDQLVAHDPASLVCGSRIRDVDSS